MKLRRVLPIACATVALSVPAYGQIQVDADGTRVEVGGGDGVQVDTPTRDVNVPSDATNAPNRNRGNQIEARARGQVMDRQAVDWLITDQQNVIGLTEYGLTRTKTPEVRQLAETIKRDHQELLNRLQSIASTEARPDSERVRPSSETTSSLEGTPNVTRPAEANAEARQGTRDTRERNRETAREGREQTGDAIRNADGVRRPLQNLGDRIEDGVENLAERTRNAAENARETIDRNFGDDPAPVEREITQESQGERRAMANREGMVRTRPTTNMSSPWLQVHQQIASEIARQATQDLEQRQGRDFDAAFVGMLTAAHMHEIATVDVLKNYVSGDLQSTLETASRTMRQHRQSAESVMQSLK